ncbi:MAG TPA: FkbM family methyltransferase [Chitinophagaceae bacterium]|nr:FkbM family methyltransferase [Chitinophagaceae bacterium]
MVKYAVRYTIYPWKTIAGIHLPIKLKFGYSVLRFIDNGTYEISEAQIVLSKLQQGDTVLELGSGIGFISALCAKQIGSTSIHTYEANPLLMPLIKKLYLKNKVSPYFSNALLTADEGGFFVSGKNFLASTQKESTETRYDRVKVPVLNLNRVIYNIKPTYLIMDIEGSEYDVFKIIDFQTIQKVQFELHERLLDKAKVDFIFTKLQEEGFKPDSISDSRNFYFSR